VRVFFIQIVPNFEIEPSGWNKFRLFLGFAEREENLRATDFALMIGILFSPTQT